MIVNITSPSLNKLFEMNRRHSEQFLKEQPERRSSLEECPVQVGIVSCMDGRAKAANTIGQPCGRVRREWRTLGGIVEVGVPRFRASIENWLRFAEEHGHEALMLVTYHFSASNNLSLGCRGHNHNKEASRVSAIEIRNQFCRVYETVPYPVVVGIDTDYDELFVHGDKPDQMSGTTEFGQEADIRRWIATSFPSMSANVQNALASLMRGNAGHTARIRRENRPIEAADHHEFALVIGDGCWTEHNSAIVVGPYTLDLSNQIRIAAGLLWNNFTGCRTNGHEPVLLTCAVQGKKDPPHVRRGAVEEALCLKRFAQRIIEEHVPKLAARMSCEASVLDLDTRLLQPILTDEVIYVG